MKLFISCLLLIIPFSVFSQENVYYGEACALAYSTEEVTRVFLDKNGDYYPNYSVPFQSFSEAEHCISNWFEKRTATQKSGKQQLEKSTSNSFTIFQESIIQEYLKQISPEIKEGNKKVVVLIHGFRKPYDDINGDYSSANEYELAKKTLKTLNPSTRYHFIEVYWDGMYMAPEKSLKFAIRLGRMFKKEARSNAERVGFGLRKFLNALPVDQFDIISHSLGAEVTTNLLFDDAAECKIATPKQTRVNVFFIAPAISKKHFKNYLNRGSETVSSVVKDNYNLNILYNQQDIVLSKSGRILGIRVELSRLFGNTRLGCNCRKDAFELDKRFKKHFPTSKLSLYKTESIGVSHHFRSYLNCPEFARMIQL